MLTLRRSVVGVVAVLLASGVAWAQTPTERAENLRRCLTGRNAILCNEGLLTPPQRTQVRNAQAAENLRRCLTGRNAILCNASLLTENQRHQVAVAQAELLKRVPALRVGSVPSQSLIDLGGGDMMNLSTGEYIMDMGGGDKMNLGTGDYYMNMGEGDMMNLSTGEYIIGF